MGIRYRVDRALGVAFVDAEGEIGDAELVAFAERASADDEYYSGVNELVDFSRARMGGVTSEAIRRVAGLFSRRDAGTSPESRVAIVVPGDVEYGLSRMYQVFRSGAGDLPTLFRDVQEARTWLGLPEATER